MKKCENCSCEHDGSYASGRFCSKKCAKGFSTKAKRSLINEKVSKALLKGKLSSFIKKKCKECEEHFETKKKTQKFCSRFCAVKYRWRDINYRSKMGGMAIRNGLGGNRNTYAHGWYESNIAGKVYLESSYEYKVAKELDENKIKWERPSPLLWDNKKYYPDFYLNDYNIYLDPKNDYLIIKDEKKIKKVQEQNQIKVLILNKTELKWKIIRKKLLKIAL